MNLRLYIFTVESMTVTRQYIVKYIDSMYNRNLIKTRRITERRFFVSILILQYCFEVITLLY